MRRKAAKFGHDPQVFWIALGVLLLVALPLFIAPEWSTTILDDIKSWIHQNLGIGYQWLAITILIFCLWITFSPYGKIRLGKSNPKYSMYSWGSMIFCAGVATGILYWGIIEWAYYISAPPFEVEPHSPEAMEWASSYGMFHWGPAGWAFYAIPAMAIGHAYYNLGGGSFRLSKACSGILGSSTDGVLGKLIDVFFVIGLLGASGTSLGLGTPMIAAVLDILFDTGDGFGIELLIIGTCAVIFAGSVFMGLDRGIKRLSNFNTAVAFVFLAVVLLAGPTVFILKQFTSSVGLIAQNFIRMMTWTDAINNTGFVEDWSIFYWAWWTAVGPFMGIFIARISAGRSFREIVLGTVILGSAGCALFFGILGNYSMYQEIQGTLSSSQLVSDGLATTAISETILTLPAGAILLGAFAIMSVVFMATSFDSTSYVLAQVTSSEFEDSEEPSRPMRLFWAFVLVVLPLGLMLVGGLDALKTSVLLSALPLVIVYLITMGSIYIWTKNYGHES